MDEKEQTVINLIVNAGSARSSAIEAIQYAKAGDIEKADESIQTAKETVKKTVEREGMHKKMGCKADGEDEHRSDSKAHKRRAQRTEAQASGIGSRGAPPPLRGDGRGQ